MAELLPLPEAIAELVHDGDTVALEGFTHLIPHAAGHEIVRQGRRELTLIRHDAGRHLRPDDRHGLRAQARLLLGRQPRRRLAPPLPRGGGARLARAARARRAVARGHGRRLRGGRGQPAVRRAARLRGHRPRPPRRGAGRSPARSPASSSRRCARCGPTSASSTRSRPTRRATSRSGASRACRRRPCWPRAARS